MSEFTCTQFMSLYRPLAAAAGLSGVFQEESACMRLYQICDRLIDSNQKYNLTAIIDPAAVVEKHIVDSLLPLRLLAERGLLTEDLRAGEEVYRVAKGKLRCIDIGAGAGFPSLPFGAVLPAGHTQILAVDSTAKKVAHIAETAERCGMEHVEARAGRAEEMARTGPLRQSFTIGMARAVAELRILVELVSPFVKVGGYMMAMKGSRAAEEIRDADSAAKTLGLGKPEMIEYCLPSGDGRVLVLYRKERPTPGAYPRAYARILQGWG